MASSLRVGIDIHSIGSGKGGNETYYRELVRGSLKFPVTTNSSSTTPSRNLPNLDKMTGDSI